MNWKEYKSHPLLSGFEPVERQGRRMLVRRNHLAEADSLGMAGAPAATGRTVGGGRARHPLVELRDGTVAVVRAYRRGGLIRHLNRERYFFGNRAFEELRVSEAARAAGVRVPKMLAAAQSSGLTGYTATLASELITDASPLDEVLRNARQRPRAAAIEETGRQIGLMHDAGIVHPDLNLRNILVSNTDASTVYLLDFDRARWLKEASMLQRARNIRRFERSTIKLGVELHPDDWAVLARGYGSGWPFGVSGV